MKKFRSWGQLQTFLVVAEHKSYRAAAQSLGVTSSTVARHIEAITSEIGHPVFVPQGNKWELTKTGEDLVRIAESAQANLGFMLKNLDEQSEFSGSLKLNTSSFIISNYLAPALASWKEANPDSLIVLEGSDLTTAVERGEADVALRLTRPDTPGIARFKLASCRVGIYTPKDGDGSAWIGLPDSYGELPEAKMAQRFFGSEPQMRLDTFRAIARASVASGLSCIIPTCFAREYPTLELACQDGQPLIAGRELWFLFYETRKSDPAIVAAREWLKSVFPSPNRCLCGKCDPL